MTGRLMNVDAEQVSCNSTQTEEKYWNHQRWSLCAGEYFASVPEVRDAVKSGTVVTISEKWAFCSEDETSNLSTETGRLLDRTFQIQED
jgi:hypothetical protein